MLNLQQKIESYLFYTGESASRKKLANVLEVSVSEIEIALAELSQALEGRGIVLMKNDDEVLLATHPEMSDSIQTIKKQELSDPLSKSALETLTIILYKNGATKPEIDFIRGVNSGFMLRNLLIRGLIEKIPNNEDKRITKYRSTFDTLRFLGISDISELPNYETFAAELIKRESVEPEAESSVFTQ
jgi:segregation and condensation protein B